MSGRSDRRKKPSNRRAVYDQPVMTEEQRYYLGLEAQSQPPPLHLEYDGYNQMNETYYSPTSSGTQITTISPQELSICPMDFDFQQGPHSQSVSYHNQGGHDTYRHVSQYMSRSSSGSSNNTNSIYSTVSSTSGNARGIQRSRTPSLDSPYYNDTHVLAQFRPAVHDQGNSYDDFGSINHQISLFNQTPPTYELIAPTTTQPNPRLSDIPVSTTGKRHRCQLPDRGDPTVPCACTFSRPADARRHEDTVHGVARFDCPLPKCSHKGERGFKRLDHRDGHIANYHARDPKAYRSR